MQVDPENFQKTIDALSESCPFKGVFAAGGGFVFGAAMGLFLSSFEYSNFSTATLGPNGADAIQPTLRQQMKDAFRDMGKRSLSTAKNFAYVGAIYATTECVIETYRAKHDIVNSVSAGCITGGILGMNGGPQSAAIGCAGFAAFSAAIDYFLEH